MSAARTVATLVRFEIIDRDSPYYPETVALRYDVFYRDSGLTLSAVQDDLEDRSLHLVALVAERLAGYIRITVAGGVARLTQFVVAPAMRRRADLARRLYARSVELARERGASRLIGEIRLPLAAAARRAGFTVSNQSTPSPKTGIPHLHIEMALSGVRA